MCGRRSLWNEPQAKLRWSFAPANGKRRLSGDTARAATTDEVKDLRKEATLEWVDWFNNCRLLEPIGKMPPAEAEQRYYDMLDNLKMAA